MEDAIAITRTTYRVSDFLSWQRQGGLDLRPPFQRGSVWSPKAKSFFIDTIVRGYPVPLLFLQDQTNSETYEPLRLVVDGQQRLRTVLSYIDAQCLHDRDSEDEFFVLKTHNEDLAGRHFRELPQAIQQRILQFEFSVHVLPPGTANSALLEIFARMNATGTRLTAQELRNAEFAGAFKQLAYQLASQELDRWLGWNLFTKAQVARMANVEFMSELLMLVLDGLSAKAQRAINKAYKTLDDEVPHEKAIRLRMRTVLDAIEHLYVVPSSSDGAAGFGASAFATQGWFYVLFSFIHDLAFGNTARQRPNTKAHTIQLARLRRHLERKEQELDTKTLDDKLIKALRGAATDRASRQTRYNFLSGGF